MAVSISISITQNSQSVVNNTSNVTVKVNASWTYGSFNQLQKSGWLTIDGTKYTFTSYFNYNATTSGSQTLFTKTVDVKHDSDGTKTLACSASYTSGVSSGTVTASASKELTTIPRKSTLAVSNGTLGTSQTLTVTRQSSNFTHSIKAECGSASCYIKADGTTQSSESKHSDCSISFKPPISWAAQNTTGTSVSVKYTITTYNGSTSVGSNSKTVTYNIPSSVKPSVSKVTIIDTMGYSDTYGDFVLGQSKIKISVTASGNQGSTISSYRIKANGKTYTTNNITTDVLTNGLITVRVVDSRGRESNIYSERLTVLSYDTPKISMFTVTRSDADGKNNPAGAYLLANLSASVSSLNGKNTATYSLKYKKKGTNSYTSADVSEIDNELSVTNHSVVFPAETASSYDVMFVVTDDFGSTTKVLTGSSVRKLYSIFKRGLGIAFGKIAELENVFDIGFQTRFSGGILHPVLEPDTDLDDVRTPNTYVGENVTTYNYGNCPVDKGTFTLEVLSGGTNGQVWQRFTLCDKTISVTYERYYYGSSWGEWVRTSDFGGKLLWQGGYYMSESQTATLAEPVSKQKNGIVLVFSRYSSGEVRDYHFNHAFVHKAFVKTHPGVGNTFLMTTDGSFSVMATKYIYIHDDRIDGNAINESTGTGTSGVKYENNGFVLRYVIGV